MSGPTDPKVHRRLAAILAADVVGFSALMGHDEEGTLVRIKRLRQEVIEPKVADHQGRLVKTTGDGFLVEFSSPVEAIRCALAIQQALTAKVAQEPSGAIQLRFGINLGDIIIESDGDIYGDGVNIAARLEQMAEPGGIWVSGKVYEEVRDKLPYAFEDRGEQQVKNIARAVRVYSLSGTPEKAEDAAPAKPLLPVLDRPSIAVLPFTNMSGDPEQEYFADGVVEDIITALSRVRWFFVIARNSSFTYKGKLVDVRQVGRELGVRYVLEGSIRKASNRVRITGQLVETAAGRHVWADKFEGELTDIFELQDRITESVVGAIEPSLRLAEIKRAVVKPTANLDAYDLYLRALPLHYGMTREGNVQALRLLNRAIEIDRQYALARAFLAFTINIKIAQGWGEPKDVSRALTLAYEALALDREDPTSLSLAARVISTLGHDHEQALAAADRAVQINPLSAQVLSGASWVHCFACDPGPAIDMMRRAIMLSPRDLESCLLLTGLALAHVIAGQFEEACDIARQAIREAPIYAPARRALIYALAALGRMEDVREIGAEYLRIDPSFQISRIRNRFRDSATQDRLENALRAAGLPE